MLLNESINFLRPASNPTNAPEENIENTTPKLMLPTVSPIFLPIAENVGPSFLVTLLIALMDLLTMAPIPSNGLNFAFIDATSASIPERSIPLSWSEAAIRFPAACTFLAESVITDDSLPNILLKVPAFFIAASVPVTQSPIEAVNVRSPFAAGRKNVIRLFAPLAKPKNACLPMLRIENTPLNVRLILAAVSSPILSFSVNCFKFSVSWASRFPVVGGKTSLNASCTGFSRAPTAENAFLKD